MEEATPPPERSEALPDLPDAHEIIEGLFVGNADAAVEATTGPNSRKISHILDAAGCVTPAIFAALARALAEEQSEEAGELQPPPMSRKSGRTQSYSLNGIETLSAPLDDHGRTELSEDGRPDQEALISGLLRCGASFLGAEELQKKWFDFIERGLAEGKVLVHCRLGVNRSVTVVAAFLVRCRGFTPEEALGLLVEKRPCADPVSAYRMQLQTLAKRRLPTLRLRSGCHWQSSPPRRLRRLTRAVRRKSRSVSFQAPPPEGIAGCRRAGHAW
ncbi:DSPTP1 [Symbiodinium sp. CCMP2592]|nr:DSPTP1 [Symbiodinium sp. CCMP2592]